MSRPENYRSVYDDSDAYGVDDRGPDDHECRCYCGKRWGLCADPSKCLRELRAREAEERGK